MRENIVLASRKELIVELQEDFALSENKIRRWTDAGILIPVGIDPRDGKSFRYHIDCVRIRLSVFNRIRFKFRKATLEVIGEKFQQVFGSEDDGDERLKQEMEETKKRSDLIKKYVNEISSLK